MMKVNQPPLSQPTPPPPCLNPAPLSHLPGLIRSCTYDFFKPKGKLGSVVLNHAWGRILVRLRMIAMSTSWACQLRPWVACL